MNFAMGALSFPQSHLQRHTQSQSRGSVDAREFPGMATANSLDGPGEVFDHNPQRFMDHQMLRSNSGADFLKANQQQQGTQFFGPPACAEAIINALQVIEQNIEHLQAMVPLLIQSQPHGANPLGMQQAAAAAGAVRTVTQLAQAAASLFPVTQPQHGTIVDPNQQSQSFGPGASFRPAFSFFDQQSGSSPMNNSAVNSMADNFSPLQVMGMGTLAHSQLGGGLGGDLSTINSVSRITEQESALTGAQNSGERPQDGGDRESVVMANCDMGVRNNHDHDSPPPGNNQLGSGVTRVGDFRNVNRLSRTTRGKSTSSLEDHEVGGTCSRAEDDHDDGDTENLPPGSYELVEIDEIEILAEHTHFCEICGKGFKRDANLRMHMRGHGDEYKTPAALARPDKASHEVSGTRPRRFSCPHDGCKRNKEHAKFQALKTLLCVKNHYRRSHCPKRLTCQKCKSKKFSVMADLKTHEKHCGCDKWQCSCGTTFSRKDKLFGHIGLFAGHTPAATSRDLENSSGALNRADAGDTSSHSGNARGPNKSLGGGNGMGLGSSDLQGLGSRGADNLSSTGFVGQENSASSAPLQPAGNFLSSSMLQGLFTLNFLENTTGGPSSSDRLR